MELLPVDFSDVLGCFLEDSVEFLVVGAFALAAHGVSRATGDLDIWVNPTEPNSHRVYRALGRFGAPLAAHAVGVTDFARPGTVYQMGLPPLRIDVLTAPSGVEFPEAWRDRLSVSLGGQAVPVLGLGHLVRNKAAAGRAKDLADLALLREAGVAVEALLLGRR